jgi:hypothetical protein
MSACPEETMTAHFADIEQSGDGIHPGNNWNSKHNLLSIRRSDDQIENQPRDERHPALRKERDDARCLENGQLADGSSHPRIKSAIRLGKSSMRKMQEALPEVKGGHTGQKHKHHEEESVRPAIDIQCENRRIRVKYSKKWQKMKRRIMQEFHLKWKRWAPLKRNVDTSEWVRLQPPYGALVSEASYRLVIRPRDQNKMARSGITTSDTSS